MVFVPQMLTGETGKERRGVVLLVVMALLALFAVVGLSFVFYADSEAITAQWFREGSGNERVADYDPNSLLKYFLAQLIYDADDANGVYSALRGHSLARNMYGYNASINNTSPFSGIGRAHFNETAGAVAGQDSFNLINYTHYPSDGFSRKPEWMGANFVASNPSYTFPDHNNMFLASISSSGQVTRPSFYRPWMSNGRYTRLQPDPNWNEPGFSQSLTLDLTPGQTLFGANYSGNVRNFPLSNANDSFWMDLGFPVLTAPNGQKYKPLFAPLVIDLDGKLNVNVLGNIRGASSVNASNHGLGLWEANLAKLLSAGDLGNLFVGGNGVKGRYGPDGAPGTAGTVIPALAGSRYYSFLDFDGVVDPSYALSSKYLQPGDAGNPNLGHYPWPYFDTAAYGDGSVFERTNHPAIFNPLSPQGDDRVFEFKEMTELLNFGSAWLPTGLELKKLMPANLDGGGNTKRRLLSTTRSIDLGRPGAVGWLKPTDGAYIAYEMTATDKFPSVAASPFPASFPAGPAGEFGADWRGVTMTLGRLDLNRTLANYPAVDATTGNITDTTGFTTAQTERQTLARDIYNRLRWVATGKDPSVFPTKNTDEWYALRWLAQLAVNIVDFRDTDDYITPFNWDTTDSADAERWVYGTELPKLVINEVYAEADNQGADKKGKGKGGANLATSISFWAELLNPMQDNAAYNVSLMWNPPPKGSGTAYPIYKLGISIAPNLFSDAVRGEPANLILEPTDYGNKTVVLPAGTNYSGPDQDNKGFYVLGPETDFPGPAGSIPNATFRVVPGGGLKNANPGNPENAMAYTIAKNKTTAQIKATKHNLFLRRLACPDLPPQTVAGKPNFNPYVTIDYVKDIPTYDGRDVDDTGNNGTQDQIDKRSSRGRKQPYAAHSSQQVDQQPDTNAKTAGIDPYTNQPQHTFFRHNGHDVSNAGTTLTQPFDWLVHLDRYATSPVDLLQVSGYRPYELTQQLITGNTATDKHKHRAPWFDPAARIYRLFEFLEVGTSRISGVSSGGRIPGKININTMNDEEILQALCDAKASSTFTAADVSTIFGRLIASRNGGGPGNERPFKSLATGNIAAGDTQNPNGSGIDDTLFRVDPSDATKRLFEINPGTTNPHVKMELLSKIFNNVTTRSNVFAVWLTVGFFEVTNDNVKPAKLGKEINRDQNRHIRHRMFALIDRSELRLFPKMGATLTGTLTVAAPGTKTMSCTTSNIDGPHNTRWSIQPGMLLEIDSGANAETVVVQSVAGGSFTANFQMSHATGTALNIICRGNPGPVSSANPAVFPAGSTPVYDPQQDPTVGMNYWIID